MQRQSVTRLCLFFHTSNWAEQDDEALQMMCLSLVLTFYAHFDQSKATYIKILSYRCLGHNTRTQSVRSPQYASAHPFRVVESCNTPTEAQHLRVGLSITLLAYV